MADLLGTVGETLGMGANSGGGVSTTTILIFFVSALIFMGLTAFGTWFLVMWYQFKYKIKVYQRINGQFQETFITKARLIPVGKGGDNAILLKKGKKILPMPSIQSGVNTFLYFISDDGEWINFNFSDFDFDRRKIGAKFLDKEMRYARTSLQHLAEERYGNNGFWEKYGGVIAYGVLILITCIGFWLIIDKMVEFMQTASGITSSLDEILKKVTELLSSADNIKEGGTGLIQAK